jgi:hypothetical protein
MEKKSHELDGCTFKPQLGSDKYISNAQSTYSQDLIRKQGVAAFQRNPRFAKSPTEDPSAPVE